MVGTIKGSKTRPCQITANIGDCPPHFPRLPKPVGGGTRIGGEEDGPRVRLLMLLLLLLLLHPAVRLLLLIARMRRKKMGSKDKDASSFSPHLS